MRCRRPRSCFWLILARQVIVSLTLTVSRNSSSWETCIEPGGIGKAVPRSYGGRGISVCSSPELWRLIESLKNIFMSKGTEKNGFQTFWISLAYIRFQPEKHGFPVKDQWVWAHYFWVLVSFVKGRRARIFLKNHYLYVKKILPFRLHDVCGAKTVVIQNPLSKN